MKRIYNKGNLPNILQLFAKQLSGQYASEKETEFWEAESINEFEKNAESVGYEIIPTLDESTARGFLVGFGAEEPNIITPYNNYVQLKMYFIEVTESDLKAWTKKIQLHRQLQEQDMFNRRKK